MKTLLKTLFITTLLLAELFFAAPQAVYAMQALPQNTTLTILPLPDASLGKPFEIQVALRDGTGAALDNRSILFYVDDEYLGQVRTDPLGNGIYRVHKPIKAGTYRLKAVFNGGVGLDLASDRATLKIQPAVVRLQTVPPIEGIAFTLNGQRFASDKNGTAEIKVSDVGEYLLEVHAEEYSSPDKKIEFGRWAEESYESHKTVTVPEDDVIQVGLDVYHRVRILFVDLAGDPVETSRVTQITIKSAQGDVFTFKDGEPRWLPASRVARRLNGLEETKLLYSTIKVLVDSSNVVNSAQQRFFANPGDIWEISLLLYSLDISSQDALFGNPVGTGVRVIFPDGEEHQYPFDAENKVSIHSLARGTYQIQVTGIQGTSNLVPVALSRNQSVPVKNITYVDMGLAGLLAAGLALGLLFYGRPWLFKSIFRRKKPQLLEDDSFEDTRPTRVKKNPAAYTSPERMEQRG